MCIRDRGYGDRDREDDRRRDDRDRRGGYGDRDRRDYGDRDRGDDRRGGDYGDRDRRRGDYGDRDRRHGGGRDGDLVLGGYKPRMRSGGAIVPQTTDPFAAIRAKNAAQGMAVKSFAEADAVRQEQQAKSRQMVLQQQATSAAAAASKTQREVYIGNLQQVRSGARHRTHVLPCLGQCCPCLWRGVCAGPGCCSL